MPTVSSIRQLRHHSSTKLHVMMETGSVSLHLEASIVKRFIGAITSSFHCVQTMSTIVVLSVLPLSPSTSMSALTVLSSVYIVVPLSPWVFDNNDVRPRLTSRSGLLMILYSSGLTANQLLRPLVQGSTPLSCAAWWHKPLYTHEEADMYWGNFCHEERPSVIDSMHTAPS